MNWQQVEGTWTEFKGKVKEKWGLLTDNDITVIDGKKDKLLGKLQKRYGFAKEKAEEEIDTFCDQFDDDDTQSKKRTKDDCGKCV